MPLILLPAFARYLDDRGNLQPPHGPAGPIMLAIALTGAVALPVIGVVLARRRGDRQWTAHHCAAAAIGLGLTAVVALPTTAAHRSHAPVEPAQPHCQAVSGGRGCPGG
ncbi:hypothetical protein [Catellatospora methionotrophica]|uniref:hypothetical protein n=1 Tax=Catellatospora methionotrophica TaxID=121620 RepID=UPI003409302F